MRSILPSRSLRILRAIAGIVAAAAVAHADVEVAVGAEAQRAAVVIRERLRDRQDDSLRTSASARFAIAGADAIRRDHRRAVAGARVVDVEPAVGRVLRMKREAQQAALAAGDDQPPRCRGTAWRATHAVAQDADGSALLDDEEAAAAVAGMRDVDGRREPAGNDGARNRRHRRGCRADGTASSAAWAAASYDARATASALDARRLSVSSASRISRSSITSSGGARRRPAGSARFSRLICFTIRKMMNARMTKLIATVMKLPYASSGTPALVSASYVIGPL